MEDDLKGKSEDETIQEELGALLRDASELQKEFKMAFDGKGEEMIGKLRAMKAKLENSTPSTKEDESLIKDYIKAIDERIAELEKKIKDSQVERQRAVTKQIIKSTIKNKKN